jgi:hypothetical protein
MAAFLIALIPTLTYPWPLSWDIIIHVQYAMVYMKYGLVLTDPLLNAPFGQKIGYPPLFHFILALLGLITKVDLFQIARVLQPFLAMFIVLSVSFVAQRWYGTLAGLSAGFLIISSIFIGRIMLPIPENLALIFIPLAIYFYYRSIQNHQLKYALLSGILSLIVVFTHQAATLILFSIITMITLFDIGINRDLHILKNYGIFLLSPVLLVVVGIIALLLWQPDIIYSIFNQGISATTGLITSSSNRPLNLRGYLDIGYLVLIFAGIGIILSFVNMDKGRVQIRNYFKNPVRKNLFILTWIIVMFVLSIAYWFGVSVISYRLLVYLLLPLSIIGGFGLSEIYWWLKYSEKPTMNRLGLILILLVFTLSIASAVLTVEKLGLATFEVKNQYGNLEIAPPSSSMMELASWFNSNGDKSKSILTNNLFVGTFLATTTGMPIHYGFEDFNKNITLTQLKEARIGYLVLDKRLALNNTGDLHLLSVKSEFYPLVYFSKPVSSSLSEFLPDFITVAYENQDYIVCSING